MKKIIALILCLLLCIFCFAACEEKKDNGEADNDKGGESSAATVDFSVTYNSVKIELGADAKSVISALGAAKSTSPMGNCGGQGTLTKYVYQSVEIYVLTNSAGAETVDQITLLDDTLKTAKGISIGSSQDDVTKAYGNNYTKASETGMTYSSGSKNLKFTLRDGNVVGVDYMVVS